MNRCIEKRNLLVCVLPDFRAITDVHPVSFSASRLGRRMAGTYIVVNSATMPTEVIFKSDDRLRVHESNRPRLARFELLRQTTM